MGGVNPFLELRLGRPVREMVALARHTTWRIGGPARWWVQPEQPEELARVLQCSAALGIPRLLLGGGSNILMDDIGFPGVVIDLRGGLQRIRGVVPAVVHGAAGQEAGVTLDVDAGVSVQALSHVARRAGLAGAEFLAGIPGTVGGAVRMNAGAYGGEMSRIVRDVTLMDQYGQRHDRRVDALGMRYRQTDIPQDWTVVSVRCLLTPGDPESIRERVRTINRRRLASQPIGWPSAGSVFRNPVTGMPAWQLIEAAGMRGAMVGDAYVSEKHCNFFVNKGCARSGDMMDLICSVRDKVYGVHGVLLELEIIPYINNNGFYL